MVQNAPERSEYADALGALEPVLYDLPPKVIAIDGAPGVGKTTLGRFLAWRFNVSLIETDLFMIKGLQRYDYRVSEVKNVVESRMESGRPVIVEGVVVQRLLKAIQHSASFHIHVTCPDVDEPNLQDWNDYLAEFKPQLTADLVLHLPAIN